VTIPRSRALIVAVRLAQPDWLTPPGAYRAGSFSRSATRFLFSPLYEG